MTMKRLAPIGAVMALTLASPAFGQAYSCAVPDSIPGGTSPLAGDKRFTRQVPIESYTLAISWSPQFCKDYGDQPGAAFQCGGTNRFGFVLHGLWPDGTPGSWPQYCRPVPRVSDAVVRSQLCNTPSADLIQHEWDKHGSCMTLSGPAEYFTKANALFGRLRYPNMDALSRRRSLTVAQFRTAFARANPGITAAMVSVATTNTGWLQEVRLCLNTALRYRACEGGAGPGDSRQLKIWRGRR